MDAQELSVARVTISTPSGSPSSAPLDADVVLLLPGPENIEIHRSSLKAPRSRARSTRVGPMRGDAHPPPSRAAWASRPDALLSQTTMHKYYSTKPIVPLSRKRRAHLPLSPAELERYKAALDLPTWGYQQIICPRHFRGQNAEWLLDTPGVIVLVPVPHFEADKMSGQHAYSNGEHDPLYDCMVERPHWVPKVDLPLPADPTPVDEARGPISGFDYTRDPSPEEIDSYLATH